MTGTPRHTNKDETKTRDKVQKLITKKKNEVDIGPEIEYLYSPYTVRDTLTFDSWYEVDKEWPWGLKEKDIRTGVRCSLP